jgi:xanthine dehydrogenase accessory factor
MSQPLRDTARDWLAADREAVVVEVAAFKGSVPRETGTRMLVGRGEVVGTIGGGHLELQAIEAARAALAAGTRNVWQQDIALGPTLGQCCGGALTLRYAPLEAEALAAWPGGRPRFQ